MWTDLKILFNILQILGAGFAVMQVIWAKNNNANNYLFGILSILISYWIHYHSQLYADLFLDTYYLIMSIYGWIFWKFGKDRHEAKITRSTNWDYLKTGLIVLSCFGALGYWMYFHTNSDVPIWDALVVAFAWGGMWLMAKRKLQNWIFLNISNAIAIPLLIYKELYIYSALTVFLFIMGTMGYFNWRKILKNDELQSSTGN